jgi:NAD(P)-dependent dehydrogenase (short-subunit alcohol dehydrogenase family)
MLKGGGSIISTGSDSAFLGNREAWRQVEESIPVGRSCYPEDLARAALFFASDDSKYITGANLMVDGGWSVKGL